MQFFRDRRVRGRPPHPDVLTPAEWRVLEQVRDGCSNPEIARRLGLTVPTVKTHVSSMLAKLELHDRDALAAWDGEPLEVSRTALARLPLVWPLGWLRDALGSPAAGSVANGAVVVTLSVAGVAVLAALNASDGAWSPPAATATPTPTVAPTEVVEDVPGAVPRSATAEEINAFPPDYRTDISYIDEVIEIALADDVDALMDRVVWEEHECVDGWDQGPPVPALCPEGVEEGTLIEALPFQDGAGSLEPEEQLRVRFEHTMDDERHLCEVTTSAENPEGLASIRLRTVELVDPESAFVSDFNLTLSAEGIVSAGLSNDPVDAALIECPGP